MNQIVRVAAGAERDDDQRRVQRDGCEGADGSSRAVFRRVPVTIATPVVQARMAERS